MIDIESVKKLATLSRLKFSDSELNKFSNELSNIEKMISSMSEISCADIEPLTSVNDNNLKLRKDINTESDISDDLLKNTSGSDADLAREIKCFVVPKIVE